ncbi:MAG: hypothetical protein Q8Q90_01370 [bacterium]|nr:hypothetical protein [bacterium]
MSVQRAGSRIELIDLLREAGKISALKILPFVFLASLFGYFFVYSFVNAKSEVKLDQEFVAKEYFELSAMSDNLFGLRFSIRNYKQRMMSSDVSKSDVPGPYLTQKQILNWYKAREAYFRLLSDYHRMALEYNLRHEAVGYMFIYNKNLPDRNARPLSKYYDSLEQK